MAVLYPSWLYSYFQKTDIRRGESYIISPNWIVSKKATINPKNEKDNHCFHRSIIGGLNYKIKEKELKKIEKFKRVDTDFSSHQRDWEEFEQNNTSIALNILFVPPHKSEEIKLAYKSNYSKRKNQVILLMINDESNNHYYFPVKNLSELNSLGWLRGKKETIISGDNDFKDALDDALNYQNIERDPKEYQN